MLVLDGIAFAEWLDRHATAMAIRTEHLGAVIAAGVLILVWMAVGSVARSTLEGVGTDLAEEPEARLVVDAMIGAGLLALMMLLLSALQLLSPAVVLATNAGVAIVLWPRVRAAAAMVFEIIRPKPSFARIALAVAIIVLLGSSLIPPNDWDTLMYHLRLPIGALEQGSLRTPADALAFNALIGAAHLAALPLVSMGLYEGPAVLNVLLLPLLAVGTASLARAIVPRTSRWLTAGILLGCPALLLVAWSGRADVFFACAVLAVHLAALRGVRQRTRGALAIAALAAGTAIGVKSLAAAYLLALVPLAFVPQRLSARMMLWAAAFTFAATLPWLLKSWLVAGTPVYPVGYAGTLDPWLASLAAEGPQNIPIDQSALRSLSLSRQAFNLWDAFFAPSRMTIEGEGRYYALSPVLVLFPLGLFLRGETRTRWLAHALVPVLYLGSVVLPSSEINLRYLMAVYPALAALTAAMLSNFAAVVPRTRAVVTNGLALLATWPTVEMIEFRLPAMRRNVAHNLGIEAARSQWNSSGMRSLAAVSDTITALGGARDTVLLLWEARAMALRQPVLMDAFNANWPLLAQLPVTTRCLRGTGIQWVVMGRGSLNYYVARGAPPAVFRVAAFDRFAARCLGVPVFSNGGFIVFPVVGAE